MSSSSTPAGLAHRYSNVSEKKSEGATFTPSELSDFVADHMLGHANLPTDRPIRVLDPAIGHGELLVSLLDRLDGPVEVFGFDTDQNSLEVAQRRLMALFPNATFDLQNRSFLEFALDELRPGLFRTREPFDLVIANPPYVRTQIIGAKQARELAEQFKLTGRVDLYHAFLLAMADVLDPKGTAGFIVSNRFMTTKGGAATRAGLLERLSLQSVFDLGDTKIFDAAVLPAVLIAKGPDAPKIEPTFTSIYQTTDHGERHAKSPIAALAKSGVVKIDDGRSFLVSQGTLSNGGEKSGVWRLSSSEVDGWLDCVEGATWKRFGEIGKIRVGIKTTADKVFIPKTWPEPLELLKPLTTHHVARRFKAQPLTRKVLYPHEVRDGRRQAVDLAKYPKSRAYLERHREKLEGRTYVIEGGRNWYEIWVPQNPADWAKPKLVFRDIAERPTFWMDKTGSVVNGDCYWLTGSEDALWLALAIANSTFIEKFYDLSFNNKLYAGRRRFITQYVEQFPLPDPKSDIAQDLVCMTKKLYEAKDANDPLIESKIDEMVWVAFGNPNKG